MRRTPCEWSVRAIKELNGAGPGMRRLAGGDMKTKITEVFGIDRPVIQGGV